MTKILGIYKCIDLCQDGIRDRKRGLLEKRSFQKCPFSRESRESRDSRDSRDSNGF